MTSWTAAHMQISGSTVSGPYFAVRVGGDSTVAGDGAQDAEFFSAPGVVFRPRAPSTVEGDDGVSREIGAEAIGVQVGDELIPIAFRDLRLNKNFPAPGEGTWAAVGYNGGFVSLDGDPGGTDIITLYVPYDFDADGVPAKCHSIIVDPAKEAIAITHGDGYAIALTNDGIVMRADGSTSVTLKPGVFSVVAEKISLRGVVALGADTEGASPLSAGPASQPTPSVYFSSV